MKVLYLECNMGAAGDMLTAALADLIPSREAFARQMNGIGIPGLEMSFTDRTVCGIRGNHAVVRINGEEEISNDVSADGSDHQHISDHEHHHDHGEDHCHDHEHHHDEDHEHAHHHHAGLEDIMIIVNALSIPDEVKKDVRGVYALIAEAEAYAHGTQAEHIHFHEVGMMDAICDVTAVCLLMNMIRPDKVIVSPICTGFGEVRCMHGIVPVPSPAAQYLLRDVPTYAGHIRGELITPTGAALLKYFADEFGRQPMMTVRKCGCGTGMKDFESANCVRAMLGDTDEAHTDDIIEISCNLDDMTGEAIGYAASVLRGAGALDVYTVPIQMKKDRPAVMLNCICRPGEEDRFADLMLRHTTTLGVRFCPMKRRVLTRRFENIETPYGTLRVKVTEGSGFSRRKPEYEDLARLAGENNISLDEVLRSVPNK